MQGQCTDNVSVHQSFDGAKLALHDITRLDLLFHALLALDGVEERASIRDCVEVNDATCRAATVAGHEDNGVDVGAEILQGSHGLRHGGPERTLNYCGL